MKDNDELVTIGETIKDRKMLTGTIRVHSEEELKEFQETHPEYTIVAVGRGLVVNEDIDKTTIDITYTYYDDGYQTII